MSIDVAPVAQPQDSQQVADKPASHAMVVLDRLAWQLLRVLSSLKLTVALFVMGIFIILVGTLAQVDMDMWEVIDTYFRSWITSIDFQVFFPRTWFPNWQSIPYGFWFPGGAAIGAAMVVNLLAAHLVRFKTQASGRSMIVGTAVLIAGVLLTGYVIVSGHNQEGLQGQPPFSWETLWTIVKVGMVALSLGLLYGAWSVRARYRGRAIEWGLLAVAGVTIGLFGIWAIGAKENAYLGDAGMRILWQLI